MSETSLYRKYRPQEFKDVRGQEPIVSVLSAAVQKKTVGHAYLFSGPRGTGKTSMARIFARAIGTDVKDLYELDAASNTGVDSMRELLDGVSTLPFASPFKVYIIDEVHMLSKGAFNAFLKTLEEPPAFAVFILATTELQKVPETIQSRCQVFTFAQPTRAELKEMVIDVAKKEGAQLTPGAAELISMMGEGSYRDTLSILQKVLTISGDTKLAEDEVAEVIGAPKGAHVDEFLLAVASRDIERAISVVASVDASGLNLRLFLTLALAKMRAVLLIRFAGKRGEEIVRDQFGEEEIAFLKKLSGKEGASINSQALSELIGAYLEMAQAPIQSLPLELALYRLFGEV